MFKGLIFAILIFVSFGAADAATYVVPIQFPTIQSAINSPIVVDLDVIIVNPGTYVENVFFNGKAVKVISAQGPYVTVIDGNRAGSAVNFVNGEVQNSIIDGFTITNGSSGAGWGGIWAGGGIRCRWASPTIRNNIIVENFADYGGGVYCEDSNAAITDNIIKDNRGLGSGNYRGAGIYCDYESSPVITGNVITGNISANEGGGIYFEGACPSIRNNVIDGNSADSNGGGIYCYQNNPDLDITGNIVSNNTAGRGGGFYFYYAGGPSDSLTSNIIAGNSAIGTGWYGRGGGIFATNTTLKYINNTIADNTADDYGGGLCLEDRGCGRPSPQKRGSVERRRVTGLRSGTTPISRLSAGS